MNSQKLLKFVTIAFLLVSAPAKGADFPWPTNKPHEIVFAPVDARLIRLTIMRSNTGSQPCIDELEVYGSATENLALATAGAKASASSCLSGYEIHQIAHLNDGKYGNSHSWIAASGTGDWAQITLARPEKIAKVVFSRDRLGRYKDRMPAELKVEVSLDGRSWKQVATAKDPHTHVRPSIVKKKASIPIGPVLFAIYLEQYRAMLTRYAKRGIDVANHREQLIKLEEQVKQFDPKTAPPAEAKTVLNDLRRAKRTLMFRDPDLAALTRIIFVKRHPYNPSHNYSDFMDGRLRGGGGVFVLDIPRTDGQLQPNEATLQMIFDAKAGIARDVTLDYKAQTAWFAYMPNPGTGYANPKLGPDVPDSRRWHLHRLPVTGGEATQVTKGPHHDYYPCVLPDGDIAFVTTRCDKRFLCWVPTTMTLHRMRPDGGGIQAISHNNISEWFPTVTGSGQIMWTRSEYLDKGADYGHTVWAIRPDGTHCELVYGNDTPHNLANAMEVPGGQGELCATLISHFGDFNGPIAYIDPTQGRSNPKAVTIITPDAMSKSNSGSFRDPRPISHDLVLVSHRSDKQFGIYVIDRFGNRELLYQDPDIGCMTPMPLRSRKKPPVLPNATVDNQPARLAVLDVYQGLEPMVKRGSVKWLRICRELPATLERRDDGNFKETYRDFQKYYASPTDRVRGPAGWPSYVAKSVIGIVPVEKDGSAHFEAPTDVMFYLQALDGKFNEVQRMRSIMQMRPGESRTCIGCHENRLKTPSPTNVSVALDRPASKPNPPPWGAGPFWYEKVVQPALDRNCISCHDGAKGPKKLDLTGRLDENRAPASYRTLIQQGYVHHFNTQYNQQHRKAEPLTFGTVKSKLFGTLADENHQKVKLSSDELRGIKCWIDLNCPLWGNYQHRGARSDLSVKMKSP